MSIFAKKSLGQNFLIDPNYKRKIIQAVSSSGDGPLLEIGPGRGALTEELSHLGRPLTLIEKDRELALSLKERFSARKDVDVWGGDFLEYDLSRIKPNTVVVGNLPYNVASQIFIFLVENHGRFTDLFLMFQKEMALRFVAKPGTKDYGLLTLRACAATKAKILFHLPPTVFKPRPRVESSFVHFKIRENSLLGREEEDFFWNFMRKLFCQRRKILRSALRAVGLDAGDLENPVLGASRAETLSFDELLALARQVRKSLKDYEK